MKWIGTQTVYNDVRFKGDVDITGTLNLTGDTVTFTSANADDPAIIIQNTTDDNQAARLQFFKNRGAAGQDDDNVGEIDFYGYNDAGTPESQQYAKITTKINDATDGEESGQLGLYVASHNGAMRQMILGVGGSESNEVDVTIANGANSVTTLEGTLTMGSTATLDNNGLLQVANQSNITGVGTISSGTWQGTAIASAYLDADTAHLSGIQTFSGRKIFSATIAQDGDQSLTSGDGAAIHVDASTITDSGTSASGTAAKFTHVNIERPTLAATNASVTTSDAATLYVHNAPAAGTNQTITRSWSLWVDAGNARFDGSIYSGTTEAIDSSGLVTVANQSNITGVGTISSGVWNGTAIGASYVATLNQDTTGNAATVTTAAGTSDENHVVPFTTTAAGSASLLSDAGILYNPSSNLLTVGDLNVTGTSTTIGTVTSGTWQGTDIASDQQKHLMHYEFKGYATGDGTNYEIPVLLTDNQAPWEHNTGAGSDGLTALTVQTQIRMGGQTMPRACTLKKWTGWSTCSGSATAYIGLFKLTPVRNDNSSRSLVLLKETSYTALGNAKAEDFAETSFTDDSIAAGDILVTGIKCGSGNTLYFTSNIEVEF